MFAEGIKTLEIMWWEVHTELSPALCLCSRQFVRANAVLAYGHETISLFSPIEIDCLGAEARWLCLWLDWQAVSFNTRLLSLTWRRVCSEVRGRRQNMATRLLFISKNTAAIQLGANVLSDKAFTGARQYTDPVLASNLHILYRLLSHTCKSAK